MERHAKILTLSDGTLCFNVATQDGIDKINLSEIVSMEGASSQTKLHLKGGKEKIIDNSLMYWGEPLLKHGFARPHMSWIINLVYFVHYQKGKGGHVEMTEGPTITVSEGFRESFVQTLLEEVQVIPKKSEASHILYVNPFYSDPAA
jgi:DNA-binding LytR/AlgR family response regulator